MTKYPWHSYPSIDFGIPARDYAALKGMSREKITRHLNTMKKALFGEETMNTPEEQYKGPFEDGDVVKFDMSHEDTGKCVVQTILQGLSARWRPSQSVGYGVAPCGPTAACLRAGRNNPCLVEYIDLRKWLGTLTRGGVQIWPEPHPEPKFGKKDWVIVRDVPYEVIDGPRWFTAAEIGARYVGWRYGLRSWSGDCGSWSEIDLTPYTPPDLWKMWLNSKWTGTQWKEFLDDLAKDHIILSKGGTK